MPGNARDERAARRSVVRETAPAPVDPRKRAVLKLMRATTRAVKQTTNPVDVAALVWVLSNAPRLSWDDANACDATKELRRTILAYGEEKIDLKACVDAFETWMLNVERV